MDEELHNQIEALTPLLDAFQRTQAETVPAMVAEHRACYLWDRRLRTHARLFPPHGPRDLRRRLDQELAANTRHLNAIEERLVNGGEAGIEGLKAIFRTQDVRYRLRVMDEARRLFPREAERGFEEVLIQLRDDPRSPYPPELLEEALAQLRANRLAPALARTEDHSLSPTLGGYWQAFPRA